MWQLPVGDDEEKWEIPATGMLEFSFGSQRVAGQKEDVISLDELGQLKEVRIGFVLACCCECPHPFSSVCVCMFMFVFVVVFMFVWELACVRQPMCACVCI